MQQMNRNCRLAVCHDKTIPCWIKAHCKNLDFIIACWIKPIKKVVQSFTEDTHYMFKNSITKKNKI